MKDTIFSKIINKEIPSIIIYKDELITAFRDINPVAPVHIIIATNLPIPTINDITYEHEKYLSRLFIVATKIAKDEKVEKSGYRLIINCNKDGGQEIYHLHMHFLGGKYLGKLIC